MPQVISDGLRIAYDDMGRGEPVLLLMPGWCVNRSIFSKLIPKSSEHRRTLALDWRGHGESERPLDDFESKDLLRDAIAVIEATGANHVVPVAQAHSGWIAIELRRQLAQRIPKLVLLDWIIMTPPDVFLDGLRALQKPDRWHKAWDHLLTSWVQGVDDPNLLQLVREEIGSYGFEMCARAAREISSAYARWDSPLATLAALDPKVPVLHLYSQPDDPAYLATQESLANQHGWFQVRKLNGRSHFPAFEIPKEVEFNIESFLSRHN